MMVDGEGIYYRDNWGESQLTQPVSTQECLLTQEVNNDDLDKQDKPKVWGRLISLIPDVYSDVGKKIIFFKTICILVN